MATNESLKNQLAEKPQKQVAPGQLGLKALMNTPTMRKKFEEVLHDNANAFMSNVMTLVSNDSYLTQKEAVHYTGTSAGTINEWVKKGLKVIIFGENSRPKYDIKDIDEFIAKYKV